jgi:hypothetical protein
MKDNKLELLLEEKERRLELLKEEQAKRQSKDYVSSNLSKVGETDDSVVDSAIEGIETLQKYSNSLKVGAYRGILKGSASFAKLISNTFNQEETTKEIEQSEEWLEKMFQTKDWAGQVGEVVGQVGIGLQATSAIGNLGMKGRIVQGAIIEGTVFDGDTNNMANFLDDLGVKNSVIDWLKTEEDEGEMETRAKNALVGGAIGGAFEGIFSLFKHGKNLIKGDGKKLKDVSDDEAISEVIKRVEKETENLPINKKEPKRAIVRENSPELKITEDIQKKAEELINMKQIQSIKNIGIKPEQVGYLDNEDPSVFLKAIEDVQPELLVRTRKETLRLVDEQLKKDLSDPAYNIVKDFEDRTASLKDLPEAFTKQKIIIGRLAKDFEDTRNIAIKEQTGESIFRATTSLMRLKQASDSYINAKSITGRALNSLQNNPKLSKFFDSLKIMDAYDSDYSVMKLEQALTAGNDKEAMKIFEHMTDPLKNVKDVYEVSSDSLMTKLGNIISEYGVAQMLSAPSTLLVGFTGNTIIKKLRFLQDTAQFVLGQTFRTKDRIKLRAYRQLVKAEFLQTRHDFKATVKLGRDWVKSGFKDEVIDENILARFVQDQEYHHQYFSSKYIRGIEKGSRDELMNTTIDLLGRASRTPYRAIGLIDDYYKRNNFRIELSRIADEVAESRGIADKDYVGFVEDFIKAHTEVITMLNKGITPSAKWLKNNKDFIGNYKNYDKIAKQARDYANEMTFQKEIGNGFIGKGVDWLNSSGWARLLVPFKMTPINLLKKSGELGLTPVNKQLWKDIASGGFKRDKAWARLIVSTTVISYIAHQISAGNVTGSFSKEERDTMKGAGMQEFSILVGDKWIEYKQLEPFATIMGVMSDMFRIYRNWNSYMEVPKDEIDEAYSTVLADITVALSENILSKTYFKSLDALYQAFGEDGVEVSYAGNLVAGLLPASSAVSFTERVLGDDYAKEAKTFTERALSRYRFLLDRQALDIYGRPIDNIKYNPLLLKTKDIDELGDIGTREVARLGISMRPLPDKVSIEGYAIKLEPEEYWEMRRSLDRDFKLVEGINNIVKGFKDDDSDEVRRDILKQYIYNVRAIAIEKAKANSRVFKNLKDKSMIKIDKIQDTTRDNYNSLIFNKLKKAFNEGEVNE